MKRRCLGKIINRMLIVCYYIWRSRIGGERNLLMIVLNNSKKDKRGLLMEIKLGIKGF
jgi:hypothetical protein